MTMTTQVPTEIWAEIARYCQPYDKLALAFTCKASRAALALLEEGSTTTTLPSNARSATTKPMKDLRVSKAWVKWAFGLALKDKEEGRLDAPDLHHARVFGSLCEIGAFRGYTEVLEWLAQRDCPSLITPETFASAARGGQLECLQWLKVEARCPWDRRACVYAAEQGLLDVLKWLASEGCLFNMLCDVTTAAAGAGHLDCLKWLRRSGCSWDEGTCRVAAGNGHLDVLKWLRSQDCPWDYLTCNAAAAGGHLDVSQWARFQECPWDYETVVRLLSGEQQ